MKKYIEATENQKKLIELFKQDYSFMDNTLFCKRDEMDCEEWTEKEERIFSALYKEFAEGYESEDILFSTFIMTEDSFIVHFCDEVYHVYKA